MSFGFALFATFFLCDFKCVPAGWRVHRHIEGLGKPFTASAILTGLIAGSLYIVQETAVTLRL